MKRHQQLVPALPALDVQRRQAVLDADEDALPGVHAVNVGRDGRAHVELHDLWPRGGGILIPGLADATKVENLLLLNVDESQRVCLGLVKRTFAEGAVRLRPRRGDGPFLDGGAHSPR